LFPDGVPANVDDRREPAHFSDLNLYQVGANVTAGKDRYRLVPFFHLPMADCAGVAYRQEAFTELERADVRAVVDAFAQRDVVAKYTSRVQGLRRDGLDFGHYHRARSFLNAAEAYCEAVSALAAGLADGNVCSRALIGLRDYLTGYLGGAEFTAMRAEVRRLEDGLDAVRYCVVVKGDRVTVGRYSGEADYSEQVAETFERFVQDAQTDYRDVRSGWREEEFAELAVLDMVAKLYPDLFAALDGFCTRYGAYLDETVAQADRELQFYLSYLDYIAPLRAAGLPFDYPRMSTESKDEQALDTFDVALAAQLTAQDVRVVCNDLTLHDPERILVITGPNNGGKTTLARAFGQVHYLASLGCPVPGREVRLFLCDQIFTHFERQEDVATLSGKLQEELDRLRADLDRASPASVLILNEVFNSTTAADAAFLSHEILQRIRKLGALAVCVTFLDELSTLNDTTVSMVSQVSAQDPAVRTHKVIRIRADGRAYARAIAKKYGLTHDQLTAGEVQR
jgi:energy-coupling factor transporter ATP-binding protein EcfA2